MIRGLYTSASGMLAVEAQSELIAQNISNINTPGYQEQEGTSTAFQTLLVNRVASLSGNISESIPLGEMGTGVYVDSIYKINRPTELIPGTSTDLALTTPGYFVIQTPEGEQYTRKGDFRLTDQGDLVTSEGNPVMGQRGPVTGLTPEFEVRSDGTVLVNKKVIDTLQIVDLPIASLRQVGDAVYIRDGQEQLQQINDVYVSQGVLEGSNVNITGQMTKMITALRAYEANQKVIQTQDSTLDKAVNEIGKIY